MNLKFVEWLKGYVTCSLTGKHIELFINMAMKNKIHFWDFSMVTNNQARFTVTVEDFFKLKPILKKSYSRIHVIKRKGMPFITFKLLRRKGIALGLLFFVLLTYIFSSMVWSIDIEGNKKVKEEKIYQTIEELGIHQGMFKFNLPEKWLIQEHLIKKLDDIAWAGVKINGTNLRITVVEKVKADEDKLFMPRNIVSAKNAVIYKIIAEKGLPKVKVNDRVKKGDILISGIMGDEENNLAVPAKGIVLGIVWYESEVVIPLKQQWNEYTGNVIERKYIGFGERMVKYKGFNKIPFAKYQTNYNFERVNWKDYQLPVVFITEKILEYEEKERILSKNKAFELALEQTKQDLYSKIKSDSKILNEKVLHQSVENGKLTIKVLFEVLEDITATQLIIQGD